MDNRIAALQKELRLKQVELDEQKSNVDDLYKLLMLTPSAANLAQQKLHQPRDSGSPDSVRHAILTKNIREFTLSKSMELSQQIHPLGKCALSPVHDFHKATAAVSSKSRELLNRLTNAILPKFHQQRLPAADPIFNSPQLETDRDGFEGGEFVSAMTESSGEIEEIIQELFRQMESAEQLEGLFDQISLQNNLLKQQLESVETEHKDKIKALTEEHSRAVRELKARNQQSEDYIMRLENDLGCHKQMVEDLKSVNQGNLQNYQSTLQNVSVMLSSNQTPKGKDIGHEMKLKSTIDSPAIVDNSFEIRTTAQHTIEHFTDEVERETLKSQIRTLKESMLEKHNTIADLSEKLRSKDLTIGKLEEIIEKAEWVIDEKFKISSKSSISYQSKLERLRADINALRHENVDMERTTLEKETRLFDLQNACDQLKYDLSSAEAERDRLRSDLTTNKDRYQKDLRSYEENIRNLTARLESTKSEKADAETRIVEYEAEIGVFRAKVKQNGATIEELRDLLHKKEAQANDLTAESDRLRQSLSETCHQVAFLQEQLENIKSSNAKLTDDLDRVRSEFNTKAGSRDSELHQIRLNLAEAITERDRNQSAACALRNECARLSDDMAKIKDELQQTAGQLKEAKVKFEIAHEEADLASRDKSSALKKLADLQSQLDADQSKSSELRALNSNLSDANISLNAEVNRLSKQFASANEKLETIQAELDSGKAREAVLTEKYESFCSKQRKIVERNDELISDFELGKQTIEAEISRLEIAVRNNRKLLDEQSVSSTAMKDRLARLDSNVVSIRQFNSNLYSELESVELKIPLLQQEAIGLSRQSDEEVQRLRNENHSLLSRVNALQITARDLEKKLLESTLRFQSELTDLREQSGKAEDEFMAQTENLRSLENELAGLKQKNMQTEEALFQSEANHQSEKEHLSAIADQQIKAAEVKITELLHSNGQMTSQIDDLETELADTMQKLVDTQEARDQLEVRVKEIMSVASDVDEVRSDCQSWKERFLALKTESTQQLSELQIRLNTDRESFEKEMCQMNDIIDREKSERESIESQLSILRDRCETLAAELANAEKTKGSMSDEIAEHASSLAAIQVKLDHSREEQERLFEQLNLTRQQLECTKAELQAAATALEEKCIQSERTAKNLLAREEQVATLQKSFEEVTASLEACNKSLAEKSLKLETERQENAQLSGAIDRLKSELNARWNQRRQDSASQTEQATDEDEQQQAKAERVPMKLQLDEMQHRAEVLEAERADLLATMSDAEVKSKNTLDILRSELAEVSRNYNHFESLAGELHQANEDLRQSLDAAQDQQELMRRQANLLQTAREEAERELHRYKELVAQSETKIAQLTNTIQELELRHAYQDKSIELSRQNLQQRESLENTLKELNADRQRLEKSRKQYKKLAITLEHQLEDKNQEISELGDRLTQCESEVERLKRSAIEKESETQQLAKRLAEAAIALKEDAAGPLKESDLEFHNRPSADQRLLGNADENGKKDLLQHLPQGLDRRRIEKVLQSISHLSVPEIVCRYESKLHKLHVWVEKGERELSSGVQMIMSNRANQRKRI